MSDQQSTQTLAPPGETQVQPKPKATETAKRELPRYKLMLHNDDINTMAEVVHAICVLTPLSQREATVRMLQAHISGVALLLTTHKERGELYVDQFSTKLITTTLEPDQG